MYHISDTDPHLAGNTVFRSELDRIIDDFMSHRDGPPPLFDGVRATLTQLSQKYRLYLLTKGQYDEQKDKIDKSGLQPLFEELFIVAEKVDALYRMLLERHQWQADETCMIGNSPKSDINPALNMGMHAVYIPYEHTWHLDSGAAPEHHPRLRKLEFFSQLLEIF
jgi:putative hydrolase of the HAD superfamily